jgi:hypothetical protein
MRSTVPSLMMNSERLRVGGIHVLQHAGPLLLVGQLLRFRTYVPSHRPTRPAPSLGR